MFKMFLDFLSLHLIFPWYQMPVVLHFLHKIYQKSQSLSHTQSGDSTNPEPRSSTSNSDMIMAAPSLSDVCDSLPPCGLPTPWRELGRLMLDTSQDQQVTLSLACVSVFRGLEAKVDEMRGKLQKTSATLASEITEMNQKMTQLGTHDSPSSVSSLFQSTSLRTAIDPTVLTSVLINDDLKHLKMYLSHL